MKTKISVALVLTVLFTSVASAQKLAGVAKIEKSPDALKAEIDGLKADKVAWRQIPWKTCLLEGLKESREKNKPVILWIFIDRPVDDERC